ncbi:MAG: LPS export ABC transporter periplasmic protein LptC [Tepidimonas sp.]|nr:LPS export ABC transporter periplasmic protein LptC [Tepidimonas sp.]
MTSPPCPASWARLTAVGARAWDVLSLYLSVVLMGALALVTWAIVKRAAEPGPAAAVALPAGQADYTLHEVLLRRYDGQGRLSVELRGRTLAHYPASGHTEVHQARLARWDHDRGQHSVVRAAQVRLDDAHQVYAFEGQTHYERQPLPGHTGPRLTLQGQHLVWDEAAQLLQSDEPVRLTRDADTLTASRMRYDERLGLAEFTGHVRATLAPRQQARAGTSAQ